MEESPGSIEIRCRITPGEGDLRESATESKPPALAVPQRWRDKPLRACRAGARKGKGR